MRDASGMRRHVMLVRHVKSAWNDASIADHDRPLSPRGAKALPRLQDHLAQAAPPPELVLCSTSRRTVDTLAGIRAAVPQHARVETEQAVYDASADTLLGRLQLIDGDIGCALVIGHNPAVQDLALFLVGAGDPDMRAQLSAKLPTGAAVTLSFEGAWGDLGLARPDSMTCSCLVRRLRDGLDPIQPCRAVRMSIPIGRGRPRCAPTCAVRCAQLLLD
jgi:phosphohistidine phosphatase